MNSQVNKDNRPVGINRKLTGRDLRQGALEARNHAGKTDLYKTGDARLDNWLGGGFGKRNSFENITILAKTGVGKTTLALNLIRRPFLDGEKIGCIVLEDNLEDLYGDFLGITDTVDNTSLDDNIHWLPTEVIDDQYSFDDIIFWITRKHLDHGIKLFLLDNIQYLFDGVRGEDAKLTEQNKFMKKLNSTIKKYNLTVIVITHVNKSGAEGVDSIHGSTTISRNATKILELRQIKDSHNLELRMLKTRYTLRPTDSLTLTYIDNKEKRLGVLDDWRL